MIVLWVHGSVCMSFIISAVDLCVSSPSHEADQRPPSREKLTWCCRAGIPTWSGSWVCSRAMWAAHRSSRGWWWSSCPRVRWPDLLQTLAGSPPCLGLPHGARDRPGMNFLHHLSVPASGPQAQQRAAGRQPQSQSESLDSVFVFFWILSSCFNWVLTIRKGW